MYIMDITHTLLPIIGFILLVVGINSSHKNYIIASLWLSVIALILHYQTSGGEILGTYFNYRHTLIYSINLFVLLIAIIYLLVGFGREKKKNSIRYFMSFLVGLSLIGICILLCNLWINAIFIEDRLPNTPVLQVLNFKKLDYCHYSYIFYKVDKNGKVSYMCPNYYGLIPSIGYLDVAPDYVIKQLPPQLKIKFNPSGAAPATEI